MPSVSLPHLEGLVLPDMHLVHQRFCAVDLTDPGARIAQAFTQGPLRERITAGSTVALAVGSRGLARLPELVRSLVAALHGLGAKVFIVPAMGSHGGATAAGQTAVLARLGVTSESAGCPIRSDMATQRIGGLTWIDGTYRDVGPDAGTDLELHADRLAWTEADHIIPLVRIKPHTGFRGSHESGICKMLAIGLGKHAGCSRLHREGYNRFDRLIPAAGRAILATGRIPCAVAVVEHAADRPALVEVVPDRLIMEREAELLVQAKALMPRLLFDDIDVLVVEQIGKDISGTGMDPNITGRSELGPTQDFTGPRIGRVVVLGLTPATKGNATGLGLADIITESCFQAIDRATTATNVLASGSLHGGRLPVAVPDERLAILAASACVPGRPANQARIVRIRNTLALTEIAVSANLLPEVAKHPDLVALGPFTGWQEHV